MRKKKLCYVKIAVVDKKAEMLKTNCRKYNTGFLLLSFLYEELEKQECQWLDHMPYVV